MTQTKPLDVVICVGVKDVFIVKKTIHYVNRNICPQHIYLLIHKKFFGFYSKEFLEAEHVTLIDEAALVPGLNITTCREMVNSHFTKGMRAGWYFQQFLKMGFALSSYAKDYYLVWDADTLPTSPLRFFDEEGRALLTQKTEYHCPYFDTMQRLIGLDKSVDFSFIAEHMVFETSIMRSLIDKIAQNGGVFGGRISSMPQTQTKVSASQSSRHTARMCITSIVTASPTVSCTPSVAPVISLAAA